MQSGQAWTAKVPLHDDAGAVYSLEYNAVPVFSKVSSQEKITIFCTQGYPNRKGHQNTTTIFLARKIQPFSGRDGLLVLGLLGYTTRVHQNGFKKTVANQIA